MTPTFCKGSFQKCPLKNQEDTKTYGLEIGAIYSPDKGLEILICHEEDEAFESGNTVRIPFTALLRGAIDWHEADYCSRNKDDAYLGMIAYLDYMKKVLEIQYKGLKINK